jgi:hypothetical protein
MLRSTPSPERHHPSDLHSLPRRAYHVLSVYSLCTLFVLSFARAMASCEPAVGRQSAHTSMAPHANRRSYRLVAAKA